ncbi:hypothetical protein CIL05_09825 [Virgibacillus profundi]|uniref:Uncharacterized protein n=1 Tax=Virgibacillus profundi TaxID=2024555 RepID=A0A2A2IDK9_9BACI|nr:hypothetical protein [Virgibacillus profundi]PAV29662.1 hypothetical protein CIL05_09825 [Virgibacillus profundi]PXY53834.1 hypothetical protein CIT14_09920 [Virgibacillus profundi]
MLIEILFDILSDFSLLYFYVSIILSIFCAYQITHFSLFNIKKMNECYTREHHSIQARQIPLVSVVGEVIEKRDWLTNKTKRIEAPDDDAEIHSFSLVNKRTIKRGGQQWKNILYSLSLKNIALP